MLNQLTFWWKICRNLIYLWRFQLKSDPIVSQNCQVDESKFVFRKEGVHLVQAVNIRTGSNGSLIKACINWWMAGDFRCRFNNPILFLFFLFLVFGRGKLYASPQKLAFGICILVWQNYKVFSAREFCLWGWAPKWNVPASKSKWKWKSSRYGILKPAQCEKWKECVIYIVLYTV